LQELPSFTSGSGRKWKEVAGSGRKWDGSGMGDLAVAVAVAGSGRKEVEGSGRKCHRAWAAGSKSSQVPYNVVSARAFIIRSYFE
jgi:hypothetical protein